MRIGSFHRWIGMAAIVAGLLFAAGCQDYKIEVVLEPDGSGRRSVILEVDSPLDSDSTPSLEDYRAYFSLAPESDWREERPESLGADGKVWSEQATRFAREIPIADVAAWSKAQGDIRILATLDDGPYAGVRFDSSIEVVPGTSDSGSWLRYTETFRWHELMGKLIALQAPRFDAQLAALGYDLEPAAQAEMRGLMAGAFVMDIQLQIKEAGDAERSGIREVFADLILDVLRRQDPGAKRESIEEMLRLLEEDPDSKGEDRLLAAMPGLDLAFLTSIELSVSFPGPVVDSNADEVTGNTAIWHFEITDAILQPVELRARAEIPARR